jgi:hypothetical protein
VVSSIFSPYDPMELALYQAAMKWGLKKLYVKGQMKWSRKVYDYLPEAEKKRFHVEAAKKFDELMKTKTRDDDDEEDETAPDDEID